MGELRRKVSVVCLGDSGTVGKMNFENSAEDRGPRAIGNVDEGKLLNFYRSWQNHGVSTDRGWRRL